MAPQGSATSGLARPLQHTLVAPAASPVQPQQLKALGRVPSGRAAALGRGGLTAAPPPPLPPGWRFEEPAALASGPGLSATAGSLQQRRVSGAAACSALRLPAPPLVRQRRRQRLVWAAGVAGPAAAAAAADGSAAASAGTEAGAAERHAAGSAAASSAAEPEAPRLRPRRRPKGHLSAEREQELARAVAAGGRGAEGAAAELAAANVALVHHLARRFDGRGLSREDIVGEGLGALLCAAQRYRPGEARFTTFATPVIWHAMQKALHRMSRSVRLPAHHHIDMRRVRAATDSLTSELGCDPGLEAVAQACGLSVEYTAHLAKQMTQGEGRPRLPPLATPNRRGAAFPTLTPEDQSDEVQEFEECRAHEEAVQRRVEALLGRLARENRKLALVVRLRHRLGEDGPAEDGGTDRLRPFKDVGKLMKCTGAYASALYKQAHIKMEQLSRAEVARHAGQPGTPAQLQQEVAEACRDGRLAAAVARLSEERQLLLALRCGWLTAPWLHGKGRPTFEALGALWGRSACWASNNCTAATRELRQMVLRSPEESFNMRHALEDSKAPQPHFPAQLVQSWDQLACELLGSHSQAAPAEAGQASEVEDSVACSAAQQARSVAQSAAQQGAPSAAPAATPTPAAAPAVAEPAPSSSAADFAPRHAVPGASINSVVLFQLRRQSMPHPNETSPYAHMIRLSELQAQPTLAGAR